MRPIRLELENFGVYRGRHSLDFSSLDFFVIKGKTGAGKSTLVDAICYALYGAVPRYGSERAHRHLISRGQTRMFVSFEFSLKGKVYRIDREYRQDKKKPLAEFRFYEEGKLRSFREEELRSYIKDLLVDYETFTKVILLPQNKFDRFLKPEDKTKRREILNTLLGFSGLFDAMREMVREEYRTLQSQADFIKSRLNQLSDATPELLSELEGQVSQLDRDFLTLNSKKTELQNLFHSCRRRESLYSDLLTLERSLEKLKEKQTHMEMLRTAVQKATDLLPFVPKIQEYEKIRQQEDSFIKEKRSKELELLKFSDERKQIEDEFRHIEAQFNTLEDKNRRRLEIGQILQLLESYDELQAERSKLLKDLNKLLESLIKESERERELRENFLRAANVVGQIREKIKEHNQKGTESMLRQAEELRQKIKRLDHLEEESSRLVKELSFHKDRLSETEGKIQEEEDKMQSLQTELTQLEKRVEEIRSQMENEEILIRRDSELKEKLSKAREVERLEIEVEKLETERSRAAGRLEALEQELSSIERKKLQIYALEIRKELRQGESCPVCGGVVSVEIEHSVDSDLEELMKRREKVLKEISTLQKDVSHYEARLSLLIQRRDMLLKELEGKKAEHLEIELLQLKKDLEQLQYLRAELQSKEKTINQLRKSRDSLVQHLQSLRVSGAGLRERVSHLQTLLEKVQEERDFLLREIGDVQSTVAKIKWIEGQYEELRKLREEEELAQQELETLQRDLVETEKLLTSLREREKNYTAMLQDTDNRIEGMKREVEKRTGEAPSEFLARRLLSEMDELSRAVEDIRSRYARTSNYLAELRTKEANLLADLQNIEKFLSSLKTRKDALGEDLYRVYSEYGSLEEALKYTMSSEEIRKAQEELQTYDRERHQMERRIEEIKAELETLGSLPSIDEVKKAMDALESELNGNRELYGKLSREVEQLRKDIQEKEDLQKRLEAVSIRLNLFERLRTDLSDSQFPEYVSQIMLSRVVERSNFYLYKFTSGQFTLQLSEGDLYIFDGATGQTRVVSSLSGGETFLASLSLAFAVADIMSQRAPLESIFIDEGFGSLDRETRESLGEFFEAVRENSNRMVGIITHVEDIAEKFSQRVEVEKIDGSARLKVVY